MIRKILVLAMLLLSGGYAIAQEGMGSPYSFYGIGDLDFGGTMEYQAMGGVSVFADSIHLNFKNPASLSKLGLTTYSLGATMSRYSLEDENTSGSSRNASFDYLALGFPILKNTAVSFGLLPYSTVGYSLRSINEGVVPQESNTYTGTGGVNKAFLSLGFNVAKNLSVGATVNYGFGRIEYSSLNQRQGIQLGTREMSRAEISGLDYNFAVNYSKKLGKENHLDLMLTYAPEINYGSSNSRSYRTVLVYEDGSEAGSSSSVYDVDLAASGLDDTDLTLPSRLRFGLGFGKTNVWYAGAEYEMVGMGSFNNDFINIEGIGYEDASKISLGGFYVPSYNSRGSYFKRVTYRAGLAYQDTGMVINNETVNDFGMSFGVGLPVKGFSNVNLGINLGQRGTTNSGLIKENYFKVKIGLSLNDRWFVKRKYD